MSLFMSNPLDKLFEDDDDKDGHKRELTSAEKKSIEAKIAAEEREFKLKQEARSKERHSAAAQRAAAMRAKHSLGIKDTDMEEEEPCLKPTYENRANVVESLAKKKKLCCVIM